MNKKLIAAAVSAAVVAPVAAYGEVQVYGRINNAIDLNDLADEGDSQTDVSSVSSRFGIKYNKEIGNGLSAHGRYEFSTNTDNERGINDLRIGTVGVSGPFGRVDIGNQWSAYFDTFGTLISPTYTLGYYLYSSIGNGPFRSSNTIKYSNSFGPLYLELDVRLNEEDDPEGSDVGEKIRGDGIGLGLSWAVSDNFTVAVAFDNEDGEDDDGLVTRTETVEFTPTATDRDGTAPDPDVVDDAVATGAYDFDVADARRAEADRVGIAVKGTFGDYWVSVGWQNYEEDDLDAVTVPAIDDDDTGDVAPDVAGDTGDRPAVTQAAKEGADTDTVFIYGGGKFGENTSWMLGYSEADVDGDDANDDPEQLIWAVYHNLGGGLKLYYEAVDLDIESGSKDGARHLLGMRVDF